MPPAKGTHTNTHKLYEHGLQNYRRMRCMRHLHRRMPGRGDLGRRHLRDRSRQVHRLRHLRRRLPERSDRPGRITSPRRRTSGRPSRRRSPAFRCKRRLRSFPLGGKQVSARAADCTIRRRSPSAEGRLPNFGAICRRGLRSSPPPRRRAATRISAQAAPTAAARSCARPLRPCGASAVRRSGCGFRAYRRIRAFGRCRGSVRRG